jgi:DNA-directed RNA polymerase subunit H (RpoH/RPB5)
MTKHRRSDFMNRESQQDAFKVAKKMMIDGEDWDKIMQETRLRLKDLKRIQQNEIDPHF